MPENTENPLERLQVWFPERAQSTSNVIKCRRFGVVFAFVSPSSEHALMQGGWMDVCMFAIAMRIKR